MRALHDLAGHELRARPSHPYQVELRAIAAPLTHASCWHSGTAQPTNRLTARLEQQGKIFFGKRPGLVGVPPVEDRLDHGAFAFTNLKNAFFE